MSRLRIQSVSDRAISSPRWEVLRKSPDGHYVTIACGSHPNPEIAQLAMKAAVRLLTLGEEYVVEEEES